MICASGFHYVFMIDYAHVHAAHRLRLRTRVLVGQSCDRQEAACARRSVRSLAGSGHTRRSLGRLRFRTRAVGDLRDVEERPFRGRALSARDRHFRCGLRCCLRLHCLRQEGLLAIRRC
jgi:hypothetical protein